MGFLIPDKHDIFISYSHDDNELYLGWVQQFADVFRERFRLALRALTQEQVGEHVYASLRRQIEERPVDVFVDYGGLPMAGALDAAIEEEIARSVFLFVFIGPGYIASEWCEKDFEFFGRRFGNISTYCLNYVQLIFLEPDVIEKLKPGGLAQQTKSKQLYAKAYGKDDRPQPRFLVAVGREGVDNPQFVAFVDAIAKMQAERTVKLWRETNSSTLAPFGYPQPSLREQQSAIEDEADQGIQPPRPAGQLSPSSSPSPLPHRAIHLESMSARSISARNVFISYAREQKSLAQQLAADLDASGYTVWWDHLLDAGDEFDSYIRERITKADAVIVIWSEDAAVSPYVKGEARFALHLKKLVPVKVQDFELLNLPFDFQHYHTAELDDRPAILRALRRRP